MKNKYIFIYLFIILFIYLLFYLFIYLFIIFILICFNKNKFRLKNLFKINIINYN